MHPAGRALIAFWIALLLLAGGGGAILWWLGAPKAVKPLPTLPTPAMQAATPAIPKPAGAGMAAATPKGAAPMSLAVSSPLPALQEPAPGFPDRTLPIIGPDGRMPAEAYASHAGLPASGPQVAILLEGLGLSEAVDQLAVETLPAPISFAVSPYSDALERSSAPPLLDQARRNGHELWLSVPMEPAGSPADTEGGQALSLDVDLSQDRTALIWCLSRFPGYVGLTNALGGLRGDRFASSSAFGMVADAIRRRGLDYVDAGLAPHEQPAIVPPRTRHADLTIDDSPDASDIQARLSRLEQIAQQNGSALGIAGPLRPTTIERLRSWSRTLRERGITLVPVSALPPPNPPPTDLPVSAPGPSGQAPSGTTAAPAATGAAVPMGPSAAPSADPQSAAPGSRIPVQAVPLAPVGNAPPPSPAPVPVPTGSSGIAAAPSGPNRIETPPQPGVPATTAPSRTTPPERRP